MNRSLKMANICYYRAHFSKSLSNSSQFYASVVESVYTSDLKSDGLTAMRVQVPPFAP